MTNKIVVAYDHHERDTQIIHLAVTTRPKPAENEWKAALRDVIDGRKVVWARFGTTTGQITVWLRDRDGDRRVTSAPARAAEQKRPTMTRTPRRKKPQRPPETRGATKAVDIR